MLNLLELELQAVVSSQHRCWEPSLGSPQTSVHTFNHCAISPFSSSVLPLNENHVPAGTDILCHFCSALKVDEAYLMKEFGIGFGIGSLLLRYILKSISDSRGI